MKPMVIVIPSYNNRQWYRQNLGSVCAQEYDNFRALYVDDGSSDQTGEGVATFLADHAVGHQIQLIRNPVRVGPWRISTAVFTPAMIRKSSFC
jgi:glycosyltransferase involved in cell wall biosynthesis